MPPFFMPIIGVAIAVAGGIGLLADAPPATSLIVIVVGIGLGVGSLIAALLSRRSQPTNSRSHSPHRRHHH